MLSFPQNCCGCLDKENFCKKVGKVKFHAKSPSS